MSSYHCSAMRSVLLLFMGLWLMTKCEASDLADGFYLRGGISYHDKTTRAPAGTYWTYDCNVMANPYGLLELGEELPLGRRFSVALSLRHESAIDTRYDHGLNSALLAVTWKPFK